MKKMTDERNKKDEAVFGGDEFKIPLHLSPKQLQTVTTWESVS